MQHTLKLFPTLVYRNFFAEYQKIEDELFPKLESLFDHTKSKNNVFMKQGTICSYHTYPDLHKRFEKETKQI